MADSRNVFRPDIFGHASDRAWANYAKTQARHAVSTGFGALKHAVRGATRSGGSTNFSPDIFGAPPPAQHSQAQGGGGARRVVRDWVQDAAAQYTGLHPGTVRDYIKSDTGKATLRTSLGHTAQTMIQRRLKKAQKSGGIVSNVLYNFANIAMAGMMRRLKDDQTTFENVARVRRGDPDVFQMSHNELRSVLAHAKKYGGKDADQIHTNATNELSRRWNQKAEEHAGYDQVRHERLQTVRDKREQARAANKEVERMARREDRDRRRADVLKQKMADRQALHEQKLKHRMELRTVSGRGAVAKAGVQAQLKQAAQPGATAGGAKASKVKVVGQTKKGSKIVQYTTGTKKVVSKEEAARLAKGKSSGGVTPMRRSGRRRSV